jgi:RNA polymerase sigma factor (sigma-70 family)
MPADAALLRRYATDRDAEAFSELVHRHAGLVFGVCRRICGNAADAEEVAQDCFLQLARHAGRITGSLPAWLHTVAMHAAARAHRRQQGRRPSPLDATLPADDGAGAAWRELLPQIDAALATLPSEQREALVLRYLEDRSQEDIARLMGLSQPTVSRRLDEGIAALRRQLGAPSMLALVLPELVVRPPATLVAGLGKIGLVGVAAPVGGTVALSLPLVGGAIAAVLAGAVALVALTRTPARAPAPVTASPVAPPGAAPAVAAAPDTWLGINHGVVAQATLLGDLTACGLHVVRDGFNDPPDAAFAAKVDGYVAAGVEAHVSINMRGSGIDVADYPTWLRNYRQRCVDIMTAYKGRLRYYIVGNEPDMRDAFTGRLTPEQAVDFTRMAYEASRVANPAGGIAVESTPLSSPSPGGDYFARMLAAGLTDRCDYVGIHVYSNQINDGRLDRPWRQMREHGGTQKPIAVSEAGISADWAPKGSTPAAIQQWKADFLDQAWVQFHRYGIANVILFESSSTSRWPGTFALLRDGTPQTAILATTYAELSGHLKPHPLEDGGFEAPNDPKRQWVVYDDPADATWSVAGFDFQSPHGHGGAAALQIETAAPGARIVRQVAHGVVVGQPVTLSAWAYASGAVGATLRAQGYDATAGAAESAATTRRVGAWELLTLTVTPTNPWVVVELSAAVAKPVPGAFVRFDDVSLEEARK